MTEIEVRLRDSSNQFQPLGWIEGQASWNLSSPPKSIEVRLLWFTEGKGTTDMNIMESVTLDNKSGRSGGDAPFRFQLPPAPHSFSGSLISLVWAIEVVALPANIAGRAVFVMSPDGHEIELGKADKPVSALEARFRERKDAMIAKKGGAVEASSKPFDSKNPSPWS